MSNKTGDIKEGVNVIVQKGSFCMVCRIWPDRYYSFGKKGDGRSSINLDNAVGCPFGSSFRMVQEKKKQYNLKKIDKLTSGIGVDNVSGTDNRDLIDNGLSQKLSKEDIYQLRDSGTTGHDLIQTITENSSTFQGKTKFSQEKYVNKKQKQYDEVLTLYWPSVRLLANMYYTANPVRILNMRIDSLSQVLSYANIHPGGQFAVYESGCRGLVTAAMLHSIGETGNLVHVYNKSHPERECIDSMNFTRKNLETLSFVSVERLGNNTQDQPKDNNETTTLKEDPLNGNKGENDKHDKPNEIPTVVDASVKDTNDKKDVTMLQGDEEDVTMLQGDKEDVTMLQGDKEDVTMLQGDKEDVTMLQGDKEDVTMLQDDKEADTGVDNPKNMENDNSSKKKTKQRPVLRFVRQRKEDIAKSLEVLERGVHSVVVACRQHPTAITLSLFRYLVPGHPFVVFSPYQEPLIELYQKLKAEGGVNLKLSETWLRNYQILPMRTHPEISMSGGGGYILYGHKIKL